MSETDIRERVRERYAAAASDASGCCGGSPDSSCGSADHAFGGALYDEASRADVPEAAVEASLGCGVPTAVADLHGGETVLDLGSGAGADVLISARRVGRAGKAIGLDMTDEMLELARANAREAARVLRPGGCFAVSDVLADPDMDEATRSDMQQWTGCIAGALTRTEYEAALAGAGLTDVEIVETHRVHEHASSAIIRARKPGNGPP